MRAIFVFFIILSITGCNRTKQEEMSRFHEDGRVKPSIAIASVLDTTSFDASWSLSEEFTEEIIHSIASSKEVFVHPKQESPFTENPFGSDLSWMKREFQGEEFVAFLELVEHEFTPIRSAGVTAQEAPSNLNMAVRVRVIDLRPEQPKVVLQEMLRDSYFVPKTLIPTDYTTDVWGTDGYRKSPMGVAHAGFVQEIASRITDYIQLAKSR